MPRLRFLNQVLLFLLLTGGSFISPAEVLPLRYYTTTDGLAHDHVTRIVRDSRGLLWFCTSEGLSRFDGYQFKNYTRDAGLPHRTVSDLLELGDGSYLVGTGDGLAWFNPNGVSRRWRGWENATPTNDQPLMFVPLRPADAKDDWSIAKLTMDHAGTVWAATSQGLYRVDRVTGIDWKLTPNNRAEWKSVEMDSLIFDRSGCLWITGRFGLFRVLPGGQVQVVNEKLSLVSLFLDKNGDVWGGARGEGEGGVFQFSCPDLNPPKLLQRFTMKDGLPADNWLHTFIETRDGGFLVASGGGLGQMVRPTSTNITTFRTISNVDAVGLAEDIGGNLWFGTESSGVVRLSRGG